MNGLELVLFSEDVGTIDVAITLSGPRMGITEVQLSISSDDATGTLNMILWHCGLLFRS